MFLLNNNLSKNSSTRLTTDGVRIPAFFLGGVMRNFISLLQISFEGHFAVTTVLE
jgi:hypothetical protein